MRLLQKLIILSGLLTVTGESYARDIGVQLPLPVSPAGANPAAVAAPRIDWLLQVQSHVNRAQKGGIDLLFLGDSITNSWGAHTGREAWQRHYAQLPAAFFGIGGDRTEHLLWRVQHGEVEGLKPKLIVLLIGTNNTDRDSAPQIAEGIQAVLTELLARCPDAHILLLGLFPRGEQPDDPLRVKVDAVNQLVSGFANARVTLLNLQDQLLGEDRVISRAIQHDLIHLSPRGYEIWATALSPYVRKYLSLESAPTP